MAEQNAQQEPSMEDILASIRRILAEDGDEAKPAAAAPAPKSEAMAPPPPPPPPPEPEPMDDTEPDIDLMAEPEPMTEPESMIEPMAESEPMVEPEPEPAYTLDQVPMPEPEFEAEPSYEPPPPPPMPPTAALATMPEPFDDVLELTADMRYEPEPTRPAMRATGLVSPPTMVASTDVLADLAKKLLQQRDIGVGNRDLTLEGLVREILKPVLKEWLDKNLPYLIERLVKREIDMMINRAERLED